MTQQEMREVYIGIFCGCDMYIRVPDYLDNEKFNWSELWGSYVKSEIKAGVEHELSKDLSPTQKFIKKLFKI